MPAYSATTLLYAIHMSTLLSQETVELLMSGLCVTILLTVITSTGSLLIGIAVGWARMSLSPWLRGIAVSYIELFRNVPALIAVVFWAYALPNAFDLETRKLIFFDNTCINILARFTGLPIPYYAIGAVIGLTLNTSAYIAELFRAGVGTLSRDQWEASRTLGASPWWSFRRLLLPHGLQVAAPALVSRLVHNLKNTALASFVAVPEFFKAVQTSITHTFHAVELLLVATAAYWVLTWTFAIMFRRIITRVAGDGCPARAV